MVISERAMTLASAFSGDHVTVVPFMEGEASMVARLSYAGCLCWVTVGLLAAGTAFPSPPQEHQNQVQAFLDAGEFAPAIDLARRTTDTKQRDDLLGQIVHAQASAGAKDASILSASEISDDRARKRALGNAAASPGAQGGGVEPDFESLIELITSTVRPTTWDEVGGPGSIKEFPNGVWVDPQGTLRSVTPQEANDLALLRNDSKPRAGQEDVRHTAPMRMVSLPRLEKSVQLRLAAGKQPTVEMHALAGLTRVNCVFIYPDSGDIVLAGPAGDWKAGPEGALVNADNGRPVLRLDDLVVVFRQMMSGPNAAFGCRITPREENMARLQEYLQRTQGRSIKPDFRRAWLESLRRYAGKQDIEVYGLDPHTRAAQVIVEADYRMKLVGMGLEPGVPGVVSYLKMVKVGPGQPPPPMTVFRWWFTMNYDAVQCSPDRLAFALKGQGVKLETENEFLTAQGQQVHTGTSDGLNAKFARSFTEHFEQLCDKYPIYGELRNLFDLAIVAALIREETAADKIGWHMTCFGDPQAYQVELAEAPTEVESVVNCRVIAGRTIIAGVSGGVAVRPESLVCRQSISVDNGSTRQKQRSAAAANNRKLPNDRWWWD
jgi:hypothetical protein